MLHTVLSTRRTRGMTLSSRKSTVRSGSGSQSQSCLHFAAGNPALRPPPCLLATARPASNEETLTILTRPSTPTTPLMISSRSSVSHLLVSHDGDDGEYPTWPEHGSTSTSFRARSRGPADTRPHAVGATLVHYEVALVDRLAQAFTGENASVLDSIQEVSGVLTIKVSGESGRVKLIAEGSSSAVTKARQLIDAKLSQSAVRLLIAIRFSTIIPPQLSVEAVKVPHCGPKFAQMTGKSLFRLTERSPITPTGSEFDAPLPTSSSNSSIDTAASPPFFTFASRSTSNASLASDEPGSLPDISDFSSHKQAYIASIVDECEGAVQSRSLARCQVFLGNQYFYPNSDESIPLQLEPDHKWSIEEIAKWRLDGANKDLTSYFCVSLSRPTVKRLRRKLVEKFGFGLIRETSRVRIQHLDRFRAVYAVATCDLRGGEIRDVEPGITGNGTLVLVKCSTLPCKSFFLSITKPGDAMGSPVCEGTDLRVKILADKAATSPSQALSQALNHASWDLDMNGVFAVHLKLDEQRFLPSQTEVRWLAKSRYQTERLRATVCEVRQDGSSQHWYEIEVSSKPLNNKLAAAAQQGRTSMDRSKMAHLVCELLEFGHELVESLKEDM